jgi:glycosyltransferase involved in cell wall biosynthesis
MLYVGNLEHYQGVDLLMDGFAAAAQPGRRAGDHRRINEKDVEAYRARRGAGPGRAHSPAGAAPAGRLQYYLEQADVLVSPRLRGVNTPMKIYSYLLAGKAVVATRIESHTQVMEDDFTRPGGAGGRRDGPCASC